MELKAECITDLLTSEPPDIRTDAEGVYLDRGRYFIEWARLNSKAKLLEWVHHLMEKVWFTDRECTALIETVCLHFGWELSVNA